MSALSRQLLSCSSKKGVRVHSYRAQASTHLSLHVKLVADGARLCHGSAYEKR